MSEALRHEYLRYKRSGIQFALVIIDVDHFKRVNDKYGHNTGDLVHKQIADNLFPVIKQVTVSIGVAVIDPNDQSQDSLIHRADLALYKVKKSGRNQVLAAELPS
jgi:PleD family two-component response regulator